MKTVAYIGVFLVVIMSLSSCSIKQLRQDKTDDSYKLARIESQEYPRKKELNYNNGTLDMSNVMNFDKENINLYFYDPREEILAPENRQIIKINNKAFVKTIVEELIKGPANDSLKPVMSKNTQVIDIQESDNILTIDFSSDFLDSDSLLLARTAIANTMTQLAPYKYVNILVDGKCLTSNGKDEGNAVGLLAKTTNNLKEIYYLETQEAGEKEQLSKINIALYFKDVEGDYLLPEVRNIAYKKGELARAIVEEVIKGPLNPDSGKYPTIPKGTVLKAYKVVTDDIDNTNGLELYFSRELKSNFKSRAKDETLMIGSLVMSLSGIPNISFVKIYYEDENGNPTDNPIDAFPLETRFNTSIFEPYIGQSIKVYYGSKKGDSLVAEYRAIDKDENQTLRNIINKLFEEPAKADSVKIMPSHIKAEDINVTVDEKTAVVDLPEKFFMQSGKKVNYVLILYSIVNSLTDSENMENIDEVQFLVDGKIVDNIKGVSLKEPFAGNPALTK